MASAFRGLMVGGVVLLGGWACSRGGTRAEGEVAAAIGAALRGHAATVGGVEVSGASLRLVREPIRLRVTDLHAPDDEPQLAHFHVLATVDGVPSGRLDACAIGVGATREGRIEELAEAYVSGAFAPLLSAARRTAVLSSRHAWGDEPWAVPGRRGHVGPLRGRGLQQLPPDLEDAELFSGIPGLPEDGKLHLVKVVLLYQGGAWTRNVEVDGEPVGTRNQPWPRLGEPSEPVMLVRFEAYGQPDQPPPPGAREQALARLARREAWLFTPEQCPLEVLPASFEELGYTPAACAGGRLAACLAGCEQGAADLCHAAAVDVQRTGSDEAGALALFGRACRLGYASSCTNAAASRLRKGAPPEACSLQTFELVCERAEDPWACTMFGGALSSGVGVPKDVERARRTLGRACRRDENDPACQVARGILGALERKPGPPSAP